MPYECEYCNSILSTKHNLNLHIKTARYCIEIQQRNGINIVKEHYTCKCGQQYSTKGNLVKHQKNCNEYNQITNTTNNNTNITNNTLNNNGNININNNTVNIYVNFSLTNYTQESLIEKLQPLITGELLSKGISAVTDIVVDCILQNDGKYCYRCVDRSRNKFMMLVNQNGEIIEKTDPQAVTLRSILEFPLSFVSDKYKNDRNTTVKQTINKINNLKKDGKDFVDTLTVKTPLEYDDTVCKELLERVDREVEVIKKKHEKELKQRERLEKYEKIYAQHKLIVDIFDRSDVRKGNELWWDPMEYFVYTLVFADKKTGFMEITLFGELKFICGIKLHGYSNSLTDKVYDFGPKELKKIKNLNLDEYLDDKYSKIIE